jgi:hypothetical protein
MGGACSAYGERRGFWWEYLRDRIDPGIDGRIILRCHRSLIKQRKGIRS